MVNGIELFRAHFAEFKNHYILIGGSACDLLFSQAGLGFRATKDLDIVLTLEAMDQAFGEAFWAFLAKGGYEVYQKGDGQDCFYRFRAPKDKAFPAMIELFSRKPDFELKPNAEIGPIHWQQIDDTDAKSLSAILMNTAYYEFLHSGKIDVEGITTVSPSYLIPLKMCAWNDYLRRAAAGEKVDSRDIKKHRNDIVRLSGLLIDGETTALPEELRPDAEEALGRLPGEALDPKPLGANSLEEVAARIRRAYDVAPAQEETSQATPAPK